MLKGNFEKLHLLRYYISHFTLSGVLFHCICAFEKKKNIGGDKGKLLHGAWKDIKPRF